MTSDGFYLTGDEIIALLKGIPPVRTPYEEPEAQRGPGPSVPQAGRPLDELQAIG